MNGPTIRRRVTAAPARPPAHCPDPCARLDHQIQYRLLPFTRHPPERPRHPPGLRSDLFDIGDGAVACIERTATSINCGRRKAGMPRRSIAHSILPDRATHHTASRSPTPGVAGHAAGQRHQAAGAVTLGNGFAPQDGLPPCSRARSDLEQPRRRILRQNTHAGTGRHHPHVARLGAAGVPSSPSGDGASACGGKTLTSRRSRRRSILRSAPAHPRGVVVVGKREMVLRVASRGWRRPARQTSCVRSCERLFSRRAMASTPRQNRKDGKTPFLI